jgi:hypothetical protein
MAAANKEQSDEAMERYRVKPRVNCQLKETSDNLEQESIACQQEI